MTVNIYKKVKDCLECPLEKTVVSEDKKYRFHICTEEQKVLPPPELKKAEWGFYSIVKIPDWCPFKEVQKELSVYEITIHTKLMDGKSKGITFLAGAVPAINELKAIKRLIKEYEKEEEGE